MRARFAPSPTGFLHLGHAFSALTAARLAREMGGEFLLRIEDIDTARARPKFETAILEDLGWLGLSWPRPVMRQSARMKAYGNALDALASSNLIYPCSCSRRDIVTALSAPQAARAHAGPDGPVYPGTCRGRAIASRKPGDALRFDMAGAVEFLGGHGAIARLGFLETGGQNPGWRALKARELITSCGDIVLARRDIRTSYHLAVVIDDAAQDITHVSRGLDLQPATQIHVVLQAVLGLVHPVYHHHVLIRDAGGRRLAKRDAARALQSLRREGKSPDEVRALVGL